MLQKRWRPSLVGTILEPEENQFDPPKDPNNQNDVMHYEEAVARDKAYNDNLLLAKNYTAHFWQDWFVNYDAGRQVGPRGVGDPDAPPPQPPNGFKVMVITNEDGSIGYDFPRVGGPVCEVPSYTKIPEPQSWKKIK